MNQTPRIAILGIGNVGWNLGFRLHEIGYAVPQLISESHSASDELARTLNAEVGDHPGELSPFVDIAILCVPDDVIERTVAMIPEHVAVVHTSGSTPLIEGRERSGVLYPFQTFSKHVRPDWKGIPVFIESNDPSLEKELLVLGESSICQVCLAPILSTTFCTWQNACSKLGTVILRCCALCFMRRFGRQLN